FNLRNCKLVSTPFASHYKLSSSQCPINEDDKDYKSHVPYASAVGNLMHGLFPDILFVWFCWGSRLLVSLASPLWSRLQHRRLDGIINEARDEQVVESGFSLLRSYGY
uniref:Uncharacterized protein n=1 Tax=Oryza glaberrima TaxID=4538 RepID=I1PTC6_ORYGL